MIVNVSTKQTIDFDIVDDYVVSKSLASFLLSEFNTMPNTDDRTVLSHVLLLAERNSVMYYM